MGTETGVWLFNKQGLWIQGVVGKEIGVRGKVIQGAWAQRQGFGYLINGGYGYTCA